MRSQIHLGKVLGIRIGLQYSWFIIALLIVTSLWAQFHLSHPAWGGGVILAVTLITAILFFVSLLLHELAHSLVASINGLRVREITLFALGGVSSIEKNPQSAKLEFWMAFAGPLTSIVIGGFCVLLARASGGPEAGPWIAMAAWLGYINLTLAAFNLLPGYPLDGGRVLRAIVWWRTGDEERSTRYAARSGEVVAYLLIALGILQVLGGSGIGGLWIAFIGWFLLQAAKESDLRVDLRHAMQGVHVEDVMARDCPTVEGDQNVQSFVERLLIPTGQRCFAVLENGEFAGLVTPHDVRRIERDRWPVTPVHDAMRPAGEVRTVTPETPLEGALNLMREDGFNQLPVMSHGHLEGVLSRAQVLHFLQTRMEFGARA